jgi:spoIIIJ-associated protein
MPLTDRAAAANRVNDVLKTILTHSGLRLKYRITAHAPSAQPQDWQQPEISVDFAGPDTPLLLERNAALLHSLEHIAAKALHLDHEEHELISFDSQNSKQIHREELRMAAEVAAEKVRKGGVPYAFAAMNSRDRRQLHLTLAKQDDLRTESEGEGLQRHVVVYPKDYNAANRPRPFGRRGRR